MLRAAGIVALIVLATCGQTTVKTVASPSPVIAQGNWTESLTFTGDVLGQMSGITADIGDQKSECTGSRTHNGERWSDSFFGTVDSSGQPWGVVFAIANFRGPGTYLDGAVKVQLHSPDNVKVWESRAEDKVTFTVDRGQQSGTVTASMTNATTGATAAQHIAGTWNCRG